MLLSSLPGFQDLPSYRWMSYPISHSWVPAVTFRLASLLPPLPLPHILFILKTAARGSFQNINQAMSLLCSGPPKVYRIIHNKSQSPFAKAKVKITTEFLTLSIIGIWSQIILFFPGAVLCIVGCLAASLAFIH